VVHIDDKDLFQKYYSRGLAKRLIAYTKTAGANDLELTAIAHLKGLFGNEFTSKMQRMFTDVTLSEDLNKEFRKSIGKDIECK
jgi:hypothetical protein